jgi:hypothetical protein
MYSLRTQMLLAKKVIFGLRYTQISNFIRFNVIYHFKYTLINAFMEQVSIKK